MIAGRTSTGGFFLVLSRLRSDSVRSLAHSTIQIVLPCLLVSPLSSEAMAFTHKGMSSRLSELHRRTEVSTEAEPGRKAGTDRRITVGTTVSERIPEGFRPVKPGGIGPGSW